MLPRSNRLLKNKDFKRVAKFGQRYFSPLFIVKVQENKLAVTRFAIIVSLKVSKKAVRRNKLKRRFRELIRLNLPRFKKGYDVLLIINSSAREKSYQELKAELEKLLKKAKLC